MMKMLVRLLLFFCIVLVVGCNQEVKNTVADDYKYAVILSSQQRDGVLQLYDKDGTYLDSKPIKASGIDENGSAYLNGPQLVNNKWYIGVSSDARGQDFILELDPITLDIKKVPANIGDMYQYTGYTVAEDNLYTFYSAPVTGAHIIQSERSDQKKKYESDIENTILHHLIVHNKKLILLSDSMDEADPGMNIKLVHEDTLAVEKEIKIAEYQFAIDVQLIDDKLYIIPAVDQADSPTNHLLIVDFINENVETVQLPFINSRYLKLWNNTMYIVEQDTTTGLQQHSMAVMNLDTLEIEEVIEFDYVAREVIFEGDIMVSSSDDKVYIYDLKTLELKNEFNIKDADNWMFGSLLVKP